MKLDLKRCRDYMNSFDFKNLFIDELGWSNPGSTSQIEFMVKGESFTRSPLAELAGVIVLQVSSETGVIPEAKTRLEIYKATSKLYHENLLVFVDNERTQSLWYWVKRQDKKLHPRSHPFVKGQPGDLFLSKLSGIVFDFSDFDDSGDISLMSVTDRIREALDVEQVTKKFYGEFQNLHLEFMKLISGIDDERDHQWYASVLLHRLMFIYFLQRKFFLDKGDGRYLQNKLEHMKSQGKDRYYKDFLKTLFFEGFAAPEENRSDSVKKLLGEIRYLNGGLFLKHRIEIDWPHIAVPDKAFENLFGLFERYSWNLNDTPGGEDDEINPDVLGYIFEKYINQKAFGAYYTRPEITEYLCERTIHQLILDRVNQESGGGTKHFDNMGDLLLSLDARLCTTLLDKVLPDLRLLDPACGSAAFLVAAMKTLINVYSAVIGKIEFLGHKGLKQKLEKIHKDHPSVSYFIKKSIITDNLFGVDIMEEAVEIAKLRLFLALVASANKVEELEPLPNIEFNIMTGNSLVGLLQVDPAKFNSLSTRKVEQTRMTMVHEAAPGELGFTVESKVAKTRKEVVQEFMAGIQGRQFVQLLKEKNEQVALYRRATGYAKDIQKLRDGIEEKKNKAKSILNKLLLDQFQSLGIQYEQASWDEGRNKPGRSKKRPLNESDIEAQKPFHWGYEFDQIIMDRGGFDAIITNPPWEIFKPNGKEFFEPYSDAVSKKKMSIKEFEKEQARLLKDGSIKAKWLEYLNGYPHISSFYRSAEQYRNQISIVNGKKAGTDINLYKLFTEQCFNLLRPNGYCGIVIPSGIYTDLGCKQLREMLFSQTRITGLFCFENRKEIFEGVHRSFKFLVLSYEKGGSTTSFPAAFMRHDVADLDVFPEEGAIEIDVDLVSKLSPDSMSVMEFKSPLDVQIAKKMLKFPLLGETIPDNWNMRLIREFDMTNDSHLFRTHPGESRLPLYEGKMVHQFTNHWNDDQRFWIDEKEGRSSILGRTHKDTGQSLSYQSYRFGIRSIGRTTDSRTLIVGPLPRKVFCGNSLLVSEFIDRYFEDQIEQIGLWCQALLNSFALDFYIRQMISANINMFYMYQLPVPRLTDQDVTFWPILERAARLICTTAEFDDLARDVFGDKASALSEGVTESTERARLRAELDGLVAHLYGLTEDEFAHILSTFPLVPDPVKVAAHNAFRNVERGLIK